jgi:hypothetical protein
MLTPVLPTVVKLAGCPLVGGPFLKPSSVAVLDTNHLPFIYTDFEGTSVRDHSIHLVSLSWKEVFIMFCTLG